jgi:hypothetical protein
VGRLLPWFAVAYGAGIVLYFTAEREPALWAAGSLTALCALAAVLLRRQIVPYVVALGAFGIALGFTGATIKTALIDHPVLRFATSGVTVAGFVELREESQHTDRFVLRVERMEGGRMDDKPLRVRLSVKRGTAPPASRSKPRSTRRCNRSNQAANAHRICRNINYLYTSGLKWVQYRNVGPISLCEKSEPQSRYIRGDCSPHKRGASACPSPVARSLQVHF